MNNLFGIYELLRCYPVKEAGDDGEDYVREPEGYCRWERVGVDEHLAEAEEEDIGECQGDTYTYVPSYAAATLLGRERHSHNRQYESRERKGETGMLLYKGHLNVGISPHLLDAYHFIQLIIIHRLDGLFIEVEILDTQRNNRIHLSSATDIVGQILVIVTDEILLESPALLCGIIDSRFRRYL